MTNKQSEVANQETAAAQRKRLAGEFRKAKEKASQGDCSCDIRLIRNDDGQPIAIDVTCDTPEARSEMAAAINEIEITVKARAREEQPGEMPGVPRP